MPYSIVTADFNGDGRPDVATGNNCQQPNNNYCTSNTISVFLSTGSGTFGAETQYTVGVDPGSIIAADVNGDGKPDLITANWNSDSISVLLNNGNGTFSSPTSYATSHYPQQVIATDIDGDGDLDLITANYYGDDVSIFYNNGNGTFASTVSRYAGHGPNSVAAMDVNNDGRTDLIIANHPLSQLTVYLNQGGGTFSTSTAYDVGTRPWTVTTPDMNGDGKPDLVSLNYTNDDLSVLLNNGNGTFSAATTYSIAPPAKSFTFAVGDVTGDGFPDVLVPTIASGTTHGDLYILPNNGNGSLGSPTILSSATNTAEIAATDIDSDGDIDFVTANTDERTFSIFLNQRRTSPAATFPTQNTYPTTQYPFPLRIADVNGDGKPDIITGDLGADPSDTTHSVISILLNNGNGTFTAPTSFQSGGLNPESIIAADVNGDGKPDIIDTNTGDDVTNYNLSVFSNTGNGTFAPAVSYATGLYPVKVAAADFNGDGKIDLVTSNLHSDTLSLFLNNGDGTFAPAVTISDTHWPNGVAAADFNGDGKIDLVVSHWPLANVSVFLNNGNGTFGTATAYSVGWGPWTVITTDVDHDGHPDIVVPNQLDKTISVLRNNGNGTFAPQVTYPIGENTFNIAAADLDGDGYPEILVPTATTTVDVFPNMGDGTFGAPTVYPAGNGTRGTDTGDLDGDGDVDFAVANVFDKTVSVFYNALNSPAGTIIGGMAPQVPPFEIRVTFLPQPCTTNRHVQLLVHAHNAAQIEIGSQPDLTDAQWTPYTAGIDEAQTIPWTLDAEDGEKQVYVRFMSATGNVSDVFSAHVKLDSATLCHSPAEQAYFLDTEEQASARVHPGDLFQTANSGMYYYGQDGKRHAFPDADVFQSWFPASTTVRTVSDEQIAHIPLGDNVTYRPGILVRVLNDLTVYIVDTGRRLRAVVATALSTSFPDMVWSGMLHVLNPAFYPDYLIGLPVISSTDSVFSYATSSESIDSLWPMAENMGETHSLNIVDGRVQFQNGRYHTGDVTIRFRLYDTFGKPLTSNDLEVTLTKLVHLMIVKDDLSSFQHLHPTETNGIWSVDAHFDSDGIYYLYGDIVPKAEHGVILRMPLLVGDDPRAGTHVPEPRADQMAEDGTEGHSGYLLQLLTKNLTSNQDLALRFQVTKDGKPVKSIQTWLDQYGHLITLRQGDSSDYIHTHPSDISQLDQGIVGFTVRFPHPGRYTIFGQFNVGGEVRTFPLTVDVK